MAEFKDGCKVKPMRHNFTEFTEGINVNHITSTLLVLSNLKDDSNYQQYSISKNEIS